MFDSLSQRFTKIFQSLTGHFTAENIEAALREIRLSLLEADVALLVIQQLLDNVKAKVVGEKVTAGLKPAEALVKVVNEELMKALGEEFVDLNCKTEPPAIFLVAGLQGAGKTTSVAKLARYLKETRHKKVMVVSVDVYRPAAIDQLALLAKQIDVSFFPVEGSNNPMEIAAKAVKAAKNQYMDVLIFDTAGRLHIDTAMMEEMALLHKTLQPIETLLVVDSMTGQDAANTAKAFQEVLPLTGIVLTKTDSDTRAGAALSVKTITGQPIRFFGTGEKLHALEPFHPNRIASRILGMGDILSLIEEVEQKTDQKAREKLAKKIQKGKGFDLEDYRQQLLQMDSMGGIEMLMKKLPGLSNLPAQIQGKINDASTKKMVAIINSMTLQERRFPKLVVGSRKKRIALGSGTAMPEVNRLLKQFEQMQKMMPRLKNPAALKGMMRGLGNLSSLKKMLPKNWKGE